MRVLLTGGAGYIGSVTASLLQTQGYETIILDNLSSGYRDACQGMRFVRADILDGSSLAAIFKKYRPEAVLHFAACTIVEDSIRNPKKYYFNNLVGSIYLLSTAVSEGVKKFIFSSSAAVYGEPKTEVIEENHPTCPMHPYGQTKLDFERVLAFFQQAYGAGYASLRYFNAAGAALGRGEDHRPETHIIPIAVQTALGMRPFFEIYGEDYPTPDGTCIRDYINVWDLAQGHLLALSSLNAGEGRIYNLGTGRGFSVREVVAKVKEITRKDFEVRIGRRREGDPARLVASFEKSRRELGWHPKKSSLDEIVRSDWLWRKEHPRGYKE